MVFQSYALFPHMTVMENACYGLRACGLKRPGAEARAAEKLRLVGRTGLERRLPSELSGGQQQRVAVARAIVFEPKVLLFDEPLSNLDAKLRCAVRDEISALQQDLRLTAVYVTHDQEEGLAVSDRIIVMSQARIAQDGTPRELYEQPASRFVADFIGNANPSPSPCATPTPPSAPSPCPCRIAAYPLCSPSAPTPCAYQPTGWSGRPHRPRRLSRRPHGIRHRTARY